MNTRNGPESKGQRMKDGMRIARKIGSTLSQDLFPLFLSSVFYHVVAFAILAPLISWYAGLLFSGSGRLVIANEEIVAFFLQPIGFFAFLTIAACSLTMFALEQGCLMALLIQKDEGNSILRVVRAFRYTFKRAFGILRLAFRIVLGIVLTSAPFILFGGLVYHALLSENDINYYLSDQPPEFKLAAAIGILLTTGLAITLLRYAVRVLFSLPILMFESKKPAAAIRESALKSAYRKLPIAAGIGGWGCIVAVVSSVTTAGFMWAGRLSVPFLLGHNTYIGPVIGFLFLGLAICQFLISITATASFSVLVMVFYDTHPPHVKGLIGSQASVKKSLSHQNIPVSGRVM